MTYSTKEWRTKMPYSTKELIQIADTATNPIVIGKALVESIQFDKGESIIVVLYDRLRQILDYLSKQDVVESWSQIRKTYGAYGEKLTENGELK